MAQDKESFLVRDVERNDQAPRRLQNFAVLNRSKRIWEASGLAMVSLQWGDATRQRLEHVSTATGFARGLMRPTSSDDDTLAAAARIDTIAALCRLQSAQLQNTVETFGEEVGASTT